MANKIIDVEGIGPKYAEALNGVGIETTEDLLKLCGDAKGRKEIAEKADLSEKNLLEWVNLADLMRLHGVGEEYADLLEEAGVDTVKELATRNAENLAEAMDKVNAEKNLTNKVPNAGTIQKWIDEAKTLDPVVTH